MCDLVVHHIRSLTAACQLLELLQDILQAQAQAAAGHEGCKPGGKRKCERQVRCMKLLHSVLEWWRPAEEMQTQPEAEYASGSDGAAPA